MNKEEEIAVIALGSNKGNRMHYISQSIQLLSENTAISILGSSNLYECPAVGFSSHDFINSILVISTCLSPLELLQQTQSIEKQLGRTLKKKRSSKYEARTIDLDLLFYGNKIVKNSRITIPHPEIEKRFFVLKPLEDLKKLLTSKGLKIMETKKNTASSGTLMLLSTESQLIQQQIKALSKK